MSLFGPIEYTDAGPEVCAIYVDIMATRKTDWINNFWKAIAHDPVLLKRTWEALSQKQNRRLRHSPGSPRTPSSPGHPFPKLEPEKAAAKCSVTSSNCYNHTFQCRASRI